MAQYKIVYQNLTIDDIVAQIYAIPEFPATIHIYDRVFIINNKEEAWTMLQGMQAVWYICEEYIENKKKISSGTLIAGN